MFNIEHQYKARWDMQGIKRSIALYKVRQHSFTYTQTERQ